MSEMTTIHQYLANPASLGKVAVLYGGISAEREVSLQSGQAVFQALKQAGVDVIAVDIGKNAVEQLLQSPIDRAFIALHGIGGEDGKIQAVLEWLEIPYTGSGMAASALAMDKLRTKRVWESEGLPTPKYQVLNKDSQWAQLFEHLGSEIFVKPIREGSSLGMSCVGDVDQLQVAYTQAAQFDDQVLAETKINGPEFTVAILNGVPLAPICMKTDNTFYDYAAKYESEDTIYECPCGLDEHRENEIKALAIRAFDAIGCSGWGRVDFMQDKDGAFYLLEVNTVPGMTSHSLVPMAAKEEGLNFEALCMAILAGAGVNG